jgi:hypothetical protein
MAKLATFFKGCVVTYLTVMHCNAYPSSLQKDQAFSLNQNFQLPTWILKDAVVDQLSWQGLPMKIEFLRIPKMKNDFFIEIASLIPERSVMSKTYEGYLVSWRMNRMSYVLLVEDQASGDSAYSKAILSSIAIQHETEDKFSNIKNCSMRWLPDDVQLIFSMGDKVGGINHARIDGYSSLLGLSEVRSIIVSRFKKYGWVSLAESSHHLDQGPALTVEAFCGNRHARISLQKQSFQTRISVMSIVQ